MFLKIQQLQEILAEQWKPNLQKLDTMYMDTICYESTGTYEAVMTGQGNENFLFHKLEPPALPIAACRSKSVAGIALSAMNPEL